MNSHINTIKVTLFFLIFTHLTYAQAFITTDKDIVIKMLNTSLEYKALRASNVSFDSNLKPNHDGCPPCGIRGGLDNQFFDYTKLSIGNEQLEFWEEEFGKIVSLEIQIFDRYGQTKIFRTEKNNDTKRLFTRSTFYIDEAEVRVKFIDRNNRKTILNILFL